MLDKVIGPDIAMKIMLHLVHYEEAGIFVLKLVEGTRVYIFNKKVKAAECLDQAVIVAKNIFKKLKR